MCCVLCVLYIVYNLYRICFFMDRRQAKGNGAKCPEILIKITRLGMCGH